MKNKGFVINFGGQIRCLMGNVEVAYTKVSYAGKQTLT